MALSHWSIIVVPTLTAVVSASACGESEPSGTGSREAAAEGAPPASSGGSTASPVAGMGEEGVSIFDSDPASASNDDDVVACAGQVAQAERVAVDLFVMLDISGSMLESTPSGTDKWTAIEGALESFLAAPSSDGLGVGIQYFPLNRPNLPDSCTSDADCGGPCSFNACSGALDLGVRLACATDQDCGAGALGGLGLILPLGPCAPLGFCGGDPAAPCNTPGLPCALDNGLASTCELATVGSCTNGPVCNADSYATPAVEIAALPNNAPALLASIRAQQPVGGTPSGPALSGAIQQAQAWAVSHPGHTVAAVLATDGAATDCEPVAIAGLTGLAAAGFQGAPSVRTFAIGVFGEGDGAARADLDAIARAGGTDSAFVIDTNQDISTRFLEALDSIRGTQLGCEYELPQPSVGDTLDFDLVNVDLTSVSGKTRIYRVDGAQSCGGEGGWYYDDARSPSRIISCPATCDQLESAMTGASVEIQLGCKTVLR